jgi:hypothetical protein
MRSGIWLREQSSHPAPTIKPKGRIYAPGPVILPEIQIDAVGFKGPLAATMQLTWNLLTLAAQPRDKTSVGGPGRFGR